MYTTFILQDKDIHLADICKTGCVADACAFQECRCCYLLALLAYACDLVRPAAQLGPFSSLVPLISGMTFSISALMQVEWSMLQLKSYAPVAIPSSFALFSNGLMLVWG